MNLNTKFKNIKIRENMNINKGGSALNLIFGAFLLISCIKLGSDLYVRHKKDIKSASEKKGCGCGNKR